MANNNDNLEFFGTLTKYIFKILFVSIGFVLYKLPLFVFSWLLKESVSNAMHLHHHSKDWNRYSWFYLPLRWICALLFMGCVFTLIRDLLSVPIFNAMTKEAKQIFLGGNVFIDIIFTLICLMPVGLVCGITVWLEEYANSPDIQKTNAGTQAERDVAVLLAQHQHRYPSSLILHGSLFVFNAGTKDEFSAEIDHLIITKNNLFVIETKYKSGTIFAVENNQEWQVQGKRGFGTMRNALLQCKNTCRVLIKQFELEFSPIPLVVIVGNDLKIVEAPGNVLALENLIPAIDGFDFNKKSAVLNPEEVLNRISPFIDNSADANKRHNERANLAGYKHQISNIVKASSLDL